MVDSNSLCTFVLGCRGGWYGGGGVQDKAEAGDKLSIHSALSTLACVFRQTSIEREASARCENGKNTQTRKVSDKFFLSFCKILSQNKASWIQAMVSCSDYSPLCSNLLLFLDNWFKHLLELTLMEVVCYSVRNSYEPHTKTNTKGFLYKSGGLYPPPPPPH